MPEDTPNTGSPAAPADAPQTPATPPAQAEPVTPTTAPSLPPVDPALMGHEQAGIRPPEIQALLPPPDLGLAGLQVREGPPPDHTRVSKPDVTKDE